MTIHLSARLVWHMGGWNGHVCRNPAANTYCVGNFSYPGEQIKIQPRLDWKTANAGRSCSTIDGIPPCVYSLNAFGKDQITAYSDSPVWYTAKERVTWPMPASNACIWPFEEIYRDDVKGSGRGQTYDHDKRLAFARGTSTELKTTAVWYSTTPTTATRSVKKMAADTLSWESRA
jgi:hypothetical protein